jgi:hypothetical protein
LEKNGANYAVSGDTYRYNIPRLARGVCRIHLTIEEYDYTQPAAGSFDGSFPAAASRVMASERMPLLAHTNATGAK